MCARGTPERCIRWPGHGTFLSQPSLALHSSALSLKFNYHRHGIFFAREMFSLSERDLWSPRWLRSLLLVPKVLKKDSLDMNEFIKARFWTRRKNPRLGVFSFHDSVIFIFNLCGNFLVASCGELSVLHADSEHYFTRLEFFTLNCFEYFSRGDTCWMWHSE